MSDSLQPYGIHRPWSSLGQNTTGVGHLPLLQGIFPAQGPNSGLLHCRQILYQLSHQGSPRIWEWVAYPFSRGLPDLRIEPGSPALQVDSLPAEPSGKPKNTGVGSLSILQELNQGLLHCRWILYQLSYQGSPYRPRCSPISSFLK